MARLDRSMPLRNDEKKENVRLAANPRTRTLTQRQRQELVSYFNRRAKKLDAVATTRTPSGQVLDWVPRVSQVSDRQIASPPPPLALKVPAGRGRKLAMPHFELEDASVKRGPEGTIPVLRKNVSKLRFDKTLQQYLSKYAGMTRTLLLDGRHAIPQPEDGGPHDYAFTGQTVDCFGGEGFISAYDPYTWYSDEESLGQIALANSSKQGMQTLEAGHQECYNIYGDWVPHLFVFYTTNNYTEHGDDKGGYNQDVQGWVQYSDVVYPGAISSPLSTPGGAQFAIHIKYQLYQGNWWLSCNNRWIGYYPSSLFDSTGLASKASSIAFYGEISDSSQHKEATKTDMGSGNWAADRWPWSAYMLGLAYQNDTDGAMSTYAADSIWASDTSEYTIEDHMDSGTNWGSYFWFGGPGAG